MTTARTSADISAYVSYTREFRSRCSPQEMYLASDVVQLPVSLRLRSCRHSAVHCLALAFPKPLTTVSRLIQECPILQHSSEPGWYFRFPASHHSTPHLQFIAHWDVLHDVQCLRIRQQAQDIVQIRAVCCVTWSHRILPDLNVLRARSSHQLTQSWCHRRTECFHFERPCCPSFLTIMLARIHVRLDSSRVSVSTRLKQARTSDCAVQFAVRSTLVPLPQVVPLQRWPVLSTVGSLLVLP